MAVLLSLPIFPAAGAVWHVKESSPAPTPDGRAWATAFRTIDAALSIAVAGDEVWVAAGNYTNDIVVPAGVGLLGGFAGNETSAGGRNIEANPTWIGDARNISVSRSDGTAVSTIDGFQVNSSIRLDVDSKADLKNLRWLIGTIPQFRMPDIAIVAGTNCAVNVSNVVIRSAITAANFSAPTQSVPFIERGILLREASYSLDQCKVLSASSKGAFFDLGGTGTVSRCRFAGNRGPSNSERILINLQGGRATVERSWFAGNEALAIQAVSGARALVRNNLFSDGRRPVTALLADQASNTRFFHNTVTAQAAGVSVKYAGSNGIIANNLFVGNPGRALPRSTAIFAPAGLTVRANAFHEILYSTGGVSVTPAFGNIETDWPFDLEPNRGTPSLATNSMLIGVAITLPDAGDEDFAGRPRKQGTQSDIGAFESGEGPGFDLPRVVFASPAGNDMASGASATEALQSIQKAAWMVAEAGIGDVRLEPGRYPGNIFLPFGVSLVSGPSIPIATSLYAVIDGGSSNRCVVQNAGSTDARSGAAADRLAGVKFENGAYQGGSGGGAVLAANLAFIGCAFERNQVESTSPGVFLDPSEIPGGGAVLALEGALIERCLFVSNRVYGVTGVARYLEGGAVQIRGEARVRDSVFVGNRVSLSTPGGLSYAGALGIEHRGKAAFLENNTFIGNISSDTASGRPYGRAAVTFDGSDGGGALQPTNRFNFYAYNSGDFASTVSTSLAVGNVLWLTPGSTRNLGELRLNESNPFYRPFDSSPLLDRGGPVTGMADRLDFSGQPRVVGGGIAAGAFETGSIGGGGATNVIRVRPDGDDNNRGLSWATAVRTLERAMSLSRETDLAEIWVARGDYVSTTMLSLPDGVRLLGGFSGSETHQTQRDWFVNSTVISGRGFNAADGGAPLFRVISSSRRTEISGFYLTDNRGTPAGCLWASGSIRFTHNRVARFSGASVSGQSTGVGYFDGYPGKIYVANNYFSENRGNECLYFSNAGLASNSDADLLGASVINNTFDSVPSHRYLNIDAVWFATLANNLMLSSSGSLSASRQSIISRSNMVSSPSIAAGTNAYPFISQGSLFQNAGYDSAVEDDRDLAGNPRVSGLHVDVGAMEYVETPIADRTVTFLFATNRFQLPAGSTISAAFESTPSDRPAGWVLFLDGARIASGTGASGTTSWVFTNVGPATLVARVFERGGSFVDSAPVTIVGADRPPVINSIAISPRLLRFDRFPGQPTVRVSASDNLGLKSIVLVINEVHGNRHDFQSPVLETAIEATAYFQRPGTANVSITATDYAGLTSATNFSFEISAGGWEFLGYQIGDRGRLEAVNREGLAAGTFYTTGVDGAALVSKGTFQALSQLDDHAAVFAVNNRGVAAGSMRFLEAGADVGRAAWFSNWTAMPLLTNRSIAHGINDHGEIVGSWTEPGGFPSHAFSWREGVLHSLPGPTNFQSTARAINRDGVVAGYLTEFQSFKEIPVVWRDGIIHLLPTLSGGYGRAVALNDSGVVVGTSGGRAVAWRNDAVIDLGPGEALAVSPGGFIAGYLTADRGSNSPPLEIPFLDRGRGVESLHDLLPATLDGVSMRITGINDSLVMSAYGGFPETAYMITHGHAFSASPIGIVNHESMTLIQNLPALAGPLWVIERSGDLKTWSTIPTVFGGGGSFLVEPGTNDFFRVRILTDCEGCPE